jgi:predicted NBD/HSP70 family sugar kinase
VSTARWARVLTRLAVMTPAKPSLDLLRSLTDEHVVRALIEEERLTRAELSSRTGISKPTISESVRRLVDAELVQDTGERTTGPGRIGTYYALTDTLGCALVASVAPEGIVAETLDARGTVLSRSELGIARPARPGQVARRLREAARSALAVHGRRARLAVVSAADPVDRTSGRLVHLPDAPFLVGELSPGDVLRPLVDGAVLVDNDVNWAARAERQARTDEELDDLAYLYLGEGLGAAVVSDGEVRRGGHGLAGEIAHLVVTGPAGQAMRFTDVFADLGLRNSGSTAIDVPTLLAATSKGSRADTSRAALGRAIGDVIAALVALSDPTRVVVGGTWGSDPNILNAIETRSRELPRSTAIETARVRQEPSLTGARTEALEQLRAAITASARTLAKGTSDPMNTAVQTQE